MFCMQLKFTESPLYNQILCVCISKFTGIEIMFNSWNYNFCKTFFFPRCCLSDQVVFGGFIWVGEGVGKIVLGYYIIQGTDRIAFLWFGECCTYVCN